MSEPIISAIGRMEQGEYHLRGTPISSLIREGDFVSTIWLAWTGKRPTDAERILLQACLSASIDHGIEPPSAHVARTVASCGKPMADAVAAGLLTLGPRHGNAASAASTWLRAAREAGRSAEEIATDALQTKTRLPGIGHPEYDIDPRTTALYELAKTHLSSRAHIELGLEVARCMTERKGKPLPLNIDGALGAIVADLGAPAIVADALFLVSRTAGLIAHAWEESGMSESYRRG